MSASPRTNTRYSEIAHAREESPPAQHTQWIVWGRMIARFRLFGITDIRSRAGLIARFDTRRIRPPGCLARIPCAQLMAAEWETPRPGMAVWTRQSSRKDSGDYPMARPRSELTPPTDFKGIISPLRAKSAKSTQIGVGYSSVVRGSDLPPDVEVLPNTDKCHALQICGAPAARILEFLQKGRRNTSRAFADHYDRPHRACRVTKTAANSSAAPAQAGAVLLRISLSQQAKKRSRNTWRM